LGSGENRILENFLFLVKCKKGLFVELIVWNYRRGDIFVSFSQAMVGKAAEACPTLLCPGSAPLSELRELAETKAAARLPPDFAKNLVAATLGVELTNKVRFCITSKDLFVSDL
jgi:hypothetical protein